MIEELTPADVPALVDLCLAGLDLPEDSAEAELSVGRLLTPPEGRQTVRLRVGSPTAGLEAVAFGSISGRNPALGHVELLVTAPHRRERGLAGALLAELETRLAALGATEIRLGGNPPCYVWPGIDVRYTPAMCLARAAGYEQVDTAWNMTADLSTVDETSVDDDIRRLAAQGIEVRPADRGVLAWIESTWHAGWAWEAGQSIGRPAGHGAGCHVAWRDGTPIGFAAYGANRPSWFGPMGTAPAATGLGIGRVLLRRCLLDQRANGLVTAQIGWAGPIGFYTRAVGARIGRVFWIHAKRLEGGTPC